MGSGRSEGAGEGARFERVVVTCEHGGNSVPARQRALFRGKERVLASHRGWDPGTLELARRIAGRLRAPLIAATTSRLVIDLNRSLSSASVFSEFTRGLSEEERGRIVAEHYRPYRAEVERAVRGGREERGAVLHLSVHSFTPVLRGERRELDVGLLFDPARAMEVEFCRRWKRELERGPGRALRVRDNAPYKGTDDGLTTYLRTVLGPGRYAGVELEVNQRFPRRGGPGWVRLQGRIVESLVAAIGWGGSGG